MTKLLLYMSMSLDGFVAGPNDGERHPLGQDGHRLHDWLGDGGIDLVSHRPDTGAQQAGVRRDDGHRRPIFVPTHQAPPKPPKGNVQYVTDGIESCVVQAKAAAGERDVMLQAHTRRTHDATVPPGRTAR